MGRTFLTLTALLAFAGATLCTSGCHHRPPQTTNDAVVLVSAGPAEVTPQRAKVYEGRIKDARPAWGYLIVTVGEGKMARDVRFDVRGARIVGPSGNEWKAQDLWNGDRVRIEMTDDGERVRQIGILDH